VAGRGDERIFLRLPWYGAVVKEEVKSIEGGIEKAPGGLLNGLLGRKKKD
jgi:hypothetical protein